MRSAYIYIRARAYCFLQRACAVGRHRTHLTSFGRCFSLMMRRLILFCVGIVLATQTFGSDADTSTSAVNSAQLDCLIEPYVVVEVSSTSITTMDNRGTKAKARNEFIRMSFKENKDRA